jgi:isopenicillin N synthase-like dioxygenase
LAIRTARPASYDTSVIPTAVKLSFRDVPVVDLGPIWSGDAVQREIVARELADACGRVGFLYVKNHNVPASAIAAIFETAKQFHDLPLEAKMEVSVTKNHHAQGYLHGMNVGVHQKLKPNTQEAFQIRRPLAPDDPDLLAGKPLHGPIPWPSAMPDLRDRMLAYFALMDTLGYALVDMFELALELPAGSLKRSFAKDMNSLRLLHYPVQPEDDGEHLGARPHTDTNAFTLLAQDPNGGLEIRNLAGEWVAVPPMPGTFVLNVGEVLKVWTDGIFSSTVHRVINRTGKDRYSIPYFMFPSYDALVTPLMKNPDPTNVAPEDLHTSMPRDTPFLYGEWKSRAVANTTPGTIAVA